MGLTLDELALKSALAEGRDAGTCLGAQCCTYTHVCAESLLVHLTNVQGSEIFLLE